MGEGVGRERYEQEEWKLREGREECRSIEKSNT